MLLSTAKRKENTMNFYALMKVDISEGSDFKPVLVGVFSSRACAENKALHLMEDFVELNAEREPSIDDENLRCATACGTCAWQFSVSPVAVDSISFSAPAEEA